MFFHYISYLQYPIMLIGLYFAFRPFLGSFTSKEAFIDFYLYNLNYVLLLLGLGMSFSTFQDTTKTQNKVSRIVWESPRKGKVFITLIFCIVVILLTVGLVLYFGTGDSRLQDISVGIIVLGIGQMSVLKTAIEMFEHHRKDRIKIQE